MNKEDYVDLCLVDNDATHFDKSLQELKDFSSQLYKTAEYCEATFLAAEDKGIMLENTKQYIWRAVVAAVEHLGSISANLESCLSQSTSIPQITNRKIDFLKMRIVAWQQRSLKRALGRFYSTVDFSKHHRRYILPPPTGPAAMNVKLYPDDIEAKTKGKDEEFETEEPLFLHTHNCKLALVENLTTKNIFSPVVLPVRGDGLSILPNSEQSAFQFKDALKLKRNAINRKALHNKDMASLIRRGKRIIAQQV